MAAQMTPLAAALHRMTAELQAASMSFALVGGLAVSVRSEPRFTRDVDLAVATSGDAEAEGLVRRLTADGWVVRTLVEQEAVGRLATVRLDAPDDLETAVVVDLLFASSGIETELAEDAEDLEVLPGLVLPVATLAGLIVLKILARAPGRPQDDVDLHALIEVATDGDLADARRLAGLVERRGYHRDRDLVGQIP